MVTGFLAPISKSVRIVGCGRRVRVSGGHLCALHRSTDRGGSRDLAPAVKVCANFFAERASPFPTLKPFIYAIFLRLCKPFIGADIFRDVEGAIPYNVTLKMCDK